MAFSFTSTKPRSTGDSLYSTETLAARDHLVAAVGQRTDLTPDDVRRFKCAVADLFDTPPQVLDPLAERVAMGDTLAAADDLVERWRGQYLARLKQAADLARPFAPERAKALAKELDDFLRLKDLLKREADCKAEQKKRDEEVKEALEKAKRAEDERKRHDEKCRAEMEKLKQLLDTVRDFCRCDTHALKSCNCTDQSCSVCRCPQCRDGLDRAVRRHKVDIDFFM